MLKTKKTKFIVFTILAIAVLLFLNPLIGNFDYFFGLRAKKNQNFGGDVDVSVTINVRLDSGLLASGDRYFYYERFDFIFNASVTAVEIERVNYRIYHNRGKIYTYNGTYWSNIILIKSIVLKFGDNLTCQGSVDLNYQLNSIPKNSTVNYNLIYTLSIREQDVRNYVYSKNAIFIAYIASFILLPAILFFIIHPDFHEPSKKEKEKNEKYLDYLAKRKQKERK